MDRKNLTKNYAMSMTLVIYRISPKYCQVTINAWFEIAVGPTE
jgi:hypothetical protein